MKHIVMLTRVLPHHSIGGMQAIAWDLARSFASDKYRVSIITSELVAHPQTFTDAGVHIYTVSGTSWRRSGRRWWRGSSRLFEEVLAPSCDVVFSVSAAGFALLKLRTKFPTIPFVMQAHGTSIGELMSKLQSRSVKAAITSLRNAVWLIKDLLAYPKFDAIVGVGPRVAGELLSLPYSLVLAKEAVYSIPNGIDGTVFRPDEMAATRQRARFGVQLRTKIVVSASRLHVQKGLHLSIAGIVEAMNRYPELIYLIAGDGPERGALESQAGAAGVSKKVFFLGGLSREELASVVAASDVFLFTSTRVEGLALNVLEALSCGIPAVMSEHLYDRGVFGDSVLPVRPNSASAIATAIIKALDMKTIHTNLLPKGLSLRECSSAYLALFDRLSSSLA